MLLDPARDDLQWLCAKPAIVDPADAPAASCIALAGRGKGTKVTARLVKDRLDRELVGNVSLRVLPTERPDTW